ncbi:MAG: Uma2 family endonuclease [Pirellulales bacterium]
MSHTINKYTYREYQYFPDDGRRHEIIDGDHYMNPAPSTKHQTVSRHLQFQLYTQLEITKRGRVFDAPTDVELSEHDIVQPDLLIVMNENRIITPKRIRGVPDVCIEILSESSPNQDRVLKLEMYRRCGVREYWIVDPEEETIEQHVLDSKGQYLVTRHADAGVRLPLATIPNVTVSLDAIWED